VSFFTELKRRNVIRVGLAYVLMGWVLLQGADFAFDLIGAPNWVIQSLTVIVAIGLPIALFFAWAFELTPEGIKREEDVDRGTSVTPRTGRKLDYFIIGFLVLVIAMMGVERIYFSDDEPGSSSGATNDTSIKTIAVLPFINMSSDKEQEYFSDGITEEILNRLAQVEGLQVSARTSVFSFKGQRLDVREIAKTLGVESILEGSVRRDGEQVRITAQLIRASDGFHLWSDTYDRRLESIFAVQDEISGEIAQALQVSLGIIDSTSASREVDPEAFDLYLHARVLHRNRGPGVLEAVNLFQQSLAIDPEFAPAWAGLSHALNVVLVYVTREEALNLVDANARSMEAAKKALELDPNLPTALHAMANSLLAHYRLQEAGEYFERALQADPDSTALMEDYAHFLVYTWQPEAAVKVARRMVELDPLVAVFQYATINAYQSLGDVTNRDRHLEAGLEINPDLPNFQGHKLRYMLESNQLEPALEYAEYMDLQGYTTADDVRRLIEWTENQDAPLDEGMQSALRYMPFLALFADGPDLYVEYAWNIQGASNWESKLGQLAMLASPIGDGMYRRLFAEPETKEVMREVGLPDYWREVGWPEGCSPVGEDDFDCFVDASR
jgi:TolB-like protein/Tfp pilus assembly protein PilF